jgi:hypothetical protein
VNAVLRKSMARDPEERFNSAGKFAEALNESSDQRATVTLHASEIRRATMPTLKLPAWVRQVRRREVRLALAGGALAAMLFGTWLLWPSKAVPTATDAIVETPSTPPDGEIEARVEPEATHQPRAEPQRSAPAAALLATLEVESNETATLTLDGAPLGTAPGVFDEVPPGRHVIGLDGGEGRFQEKTIVVTAGSTHRVRFDFEETAPADVSVLANGRPKGSLPNGTRTQVAPASREWTGFLTDADCGETGGRQGLLHLRCAERCIREGEQPMLYSRGKLYRIDGLDRIRVERGAPLRFRGWLEVDTIHVVDD